jgi:hypothetical protein
MRLNLQRSNQQDSNHIKIFYDSLGFWMKRCAWLILLVAHGFLSNAQSEGDVLVGINVDLIKSDYDGYFQKTQVGLEGNYFFSQKFTATAGVEVWTREGVSAVIGLRWFPINDAYIRARALIGQNDLSIGGGWSKPMTEELRFESMADFYFNGTFCIRAGLAFLIRKRN